MTENTIHQFPLNPNYGSGRYRRRIRLSGLAGRVIGELEDCNHGFRSTVLHDGSRVTDVLAETPRIPYNTCSGAVAPIKALIGTALDADPRDITQRVSPFSNCTHLYDLTLLAIGHALRGDTVRLYDVCVEDERDGICEASVWRDNTLIHRWYARGWAVEAPQTFAGRPLFRGFAAWANETFSGDEREAAFVLHKGFFVATARRYDFDAAAGTSAAAYMHSPGACHSYSPGVIEQAFRLGHTIRDFSDTPEELLKFR